MTRVSGHCLTINVNSYQFSFCSQLKSWRDNIVADIDDAGIQKAADRYDRNELILATLKA